MKMTIGDIMKKYVGVVNKINIVNGENTNSFSAFSLDYDCYKLEIKSFSADGSSITFFI